MAEMLEFSHSERSAVEALLGAPLQPPGIDAPIGDDVRGYAAKVALEALARAGSSDEQTLARLRVEPAVRTAASRLQVANDMLWHHRHPPVIAGRTDGGDTPRGIFQSQAISNIVAHAQRAPSLEIDPENPYHDGYLTVAPPGGGKTLLGAAACIYSGVGQPLNDVYPGRRLGVGIVKQRELLRQYLDPDEDFQRYLGPGVRVGGYFSDRRDGHDEFDFVWTTPRSYEKAVQERAIDRDRVVVNLLDDAHGVALAPQMQQHLGRLSTGLYMFTATPALKKRRDLRHRFPYGQFGSLRSFVEDGILSPIELYTYRADAEPESAERMAVRLAASYVESGRKTLIVCRPGGHCAQARRIADAINQHYQRGELTPHSRFNWQGDQIASAIGKFPEADTEADLGRLRRDERLIITAVATGQEGLNILDLDGLILIGPKGDDWGVQQWLGRVLRHSGRMAVASEIIPHDIGQHSRHASFFHQFGLLPSEAIEPGYRIEPKEPTASLSDLPNTDAPPPASDRQPSGAGGNPRDTYTPPAELQASLVVGEPLRQAMMSPAEIARLPPDDYLPLIPPEDIPLEWLHAILDKQTDPAICYVGASLPNDNGVMQYNRYYSPEAHAYLAAHPLAEIARDTQLSEQDIAALYSVSRRYVRDVVKRLEIEPLRLSTKHHRSVRRHDLERIRLIAAEIEKIPLAAETDVPLTDLRAELGDDFVGRSSIARTNGIEKRRHPSTGSVGIVLHVTAPEAERIRSAYTGDKIADLDIHMGFTEIAQRSGVSLSTVMDRFHALTEKPVTYSMRSSPETRTATWVDRSWGEAFAEQLRPAEIQPGQVTLGMIADYFGRSRMNMSNILGRRFDSPEKVRLKAVYPGSVIVRLLDEGYTPVEGVPVVEAIQLILAAERSRRERRRREADALRCTPIAFSVLQARYATTDDRDGMMDDSIVAKIQHLHFPAPPEGWVSHSRLLELNPKMASRLARLHIAEGDRGLFRPSRNDVLDVYYTLAVAKYLASRSRTKGGLVGASYEKLIENMWS